MWRTRRRKKKSKWRRRRRRRSRGHWHFLFLIGIVVGNGWNQWNHIRKMRNLNWDVERFNKERIRSSRREERIYGAEDTIARNVLTIYRDTWGLTVQSGASSCPRSKEFGFKNSSSLKFYNFANAMPMFLPHFGS